ncbi:thioredoxin domain-containing protein [Glaciihabitans sp. dw_435]|uniref:DsbA family protein n=1 Tax=Glaciihabitans sp. dw_435 TaxID=2720081 RepID=UPI001BD61663|nr:thioredoxin domain-containing protein [Glaciihabitans sp. dw_435]
MSIQGSGDRLTKNEKREHARELARATREADAKRKRRRRWITQGGIGVGVIAIAAIVALVVTMGGKGSAGPLNMLSDGIVLQGDGTTTTAVQTAALAADATPVPTDVTAKTTTANIVMYVDYLCPYCNQFETANSAQIESWVKAGTATLEIHPIAILDSSSLGTKYSTRAANAAACVANYDPNNFLAVSDALYASQPDEGTAGLTNDELISLVQGAGVTNTDVPACITKGTFGGWVTDETARALKGPLPNSTVAAVTGTPTVIVNGTQYDGSLTDATVFSDFVTAQMTAAG